MARDSTSSHFACQTLILMTVNCVIWEGSQEGAKIYTPGKLFKEKFKAFCHGVCAYFLVSLSLKNCNWDKIPFGNHFHSIGQHSTLYNA